MKLLYSFAFPNKYTFEMKPIRRFIEKELIKHKSVLVPFAGKTRFYNSLFGKIDIIYCDLDTTMPQPCIYRNCVEVMEEFVNQKKQFDLIISDPPFTFHQAVHTYGTEKLQDISYCRQLYTKLLGGGGILIECGFNSNGMAKQYGFRKLELLICAVGQSHNDYLILKEQKLHTKTLTEMM